MNGITFQEFKAYLMNHKNANMYIKKMLSEGEKSDCDLWQDIEECYSKLSDDLLQLLQKATGDETELIQYFVHDLDYGKHYARGMVSDRTGKNVALSTIEELWAAIKLFNEENGDIEG